MEDQQFVQFQLTDEEGEPIYIEIKETNVGGIERASLSSGREFVKAAMSFDKALGRVTPVVSRVATRMKQGLTTPADEVEVKFGLKFTADLGAVIGSVGSEVNFEITLKWQHDKLVKE